MSALDQEFFELWNHVLQSGVTVLIWRIAGTEARKQTTTNTSVACSAFHKLVIFESYIRNYV